MLCASLFFALERVELRTYSTQNVNLQRLDFREARCETILASAQPLQLDGQRDCATPSYCFVSSCNESLFPLDGAAARIGSASFS